MKFQRIIDVYIIFIIFIKVVFGVSTLADVYLTKIAKTPNDSLDKKFVFWRERAEFIFIASVSAILIIVFNPFYKAPIELSFEMKVLFFALGFILLTTADWGLFVKETPFLALGKKKQGE
jgi:hypothetical protein